MSDMMRKVSLELGASSYEIHIGSGLLAETGHRLKEHGFAGKLVIITNPTLKKHYGDGLKQTLDRGGFRVITLLVPEGEEQK